jgi:hypothetical protein
MNQLFSVSFLNTLLGIFNAIVRSVFAVPVWFFWTYMGMGQKYGSGILPGVLYSPSLVDWLGAFTVVHLFVAFTAWMLRLVIEH